MFRKFHLLDPNFAIRRFAKVYHDTSAIAPNHGVTDCMITWLVAWDDRHVCLARAYSQVHEAVASYMEICSMDSLTHSFTYAHSLSYFRAINAVALQRAHSMVLNQKMRERWVLSSFLRWLCCCSCTTLVTTKWAKCLENGKEKSSLSYSYS